MFLVQNKIAKLWYTLRIGNNSKLHKEQPSRVQLCKGSQQRKSFVLSRKLLCSSSQGWSKEQSVSPLQDSFVGQWWSGSYRKEHTFMHLFSQPGKLVGVYFHSMSCISFHLYPLHFVCNMRKNSDRRSHKIFFQSVPLMFLLERQSKHKI